MIVDLVNSRAHPDRGAAQLAAETALAEAEALLGDEVLTPAWATVGDELQGVYRSVAAAVRVATVAGLMLPEGHECRFGIGVGASAPVATAGRARILDGSAWWHARAAIEETESRQRSGAPWLRAWSRGEGSEAINAYLLLRDHLLARMTGRERRLLLGRLRGRTQAELAREERVSQPAVSQALRRSGAAAVLLAEAELRQGTRGETP